MPQPINYYFRAWSAVRDFAAPSRTCRDLLVTLAEFLLENGRFSF